MGLHFISPHPVRNIWNKRWQMFAYFSVLVFTLDNFLEINLSIAYNHQRRINISIYVSTENKVLQLKIEAVIKRQYHVLCSNNIQPFQIFPASSTFSNLQYTYIALYKVIQTYSECCKSSFRSISLIPDRLLKVPAVLSLWV